MSKWKVKFLADSLFGTRIDFDDPNNVIMKCVEFAHKDMLTAGRFYADKINKKLMLEKDGPKAVRCRKLIEILNHYEYTFSFRVWG